MYDGRDTWTGARMCVWQLGRMYKDGDMHMRARMHVHVGVCMYNGCDVFRIAKMVGVCVCVGTSCLSWGHVCGHVYVLSMHASIPYVHIMQLWVHIIHVCSHVQAYVCLSCGCLGRA